MKTLKTFMGSLLIAFAIALFVPSTAHASWGNYSYNTTHTTTSSDCSKYEEKAADYLKKYYKCYNYYYYKCYVYYTQKAKQCKKCTTRIVNCDKYKVLADKYMALYQKCKYSCYYRYYCYYNNLYKKCQAKYNTSGSVCGILFSDLDGNGVQDAGENGYSGVTITITDAEGTIHTVTTDSNGSYCQEGVEKGEAEISIDITTLPTNANVTTGTLGPITVVANQENTVSAIGFEVVLPVGSITGTVYADTNGNDEQDANEIGIAGINIEIVDANGVTHIATTTDTGTYSINYIAEGSATITVDVTTLPTGATLTAGDNPHTINVVANQANQAGTNGYTLPTPVGTVSGVVYYDKNGNGRQGPNEIGEQGIEVKITDVNGIEHIVVTLNTGAYSINNIPVGATIITIDTETLPTNAELKSGQNPNTITVIANIDNNAGSDGYEIGNP